MRSYIWQDLGAAGFRRIRCNEKAYEIDPMKRPRVFYFVATWCFLRLLIQTGHLTGPLSAYRAAGEPVPPPWDILPLLALGLSVWQTVGLVKLKRFNRWFAVVFCTWWAVALIWNATLALQRPGVKLLPVATFFSVLITFNLLSAWYLSRRRFREFAVEFVAERGRARHSPQMQELADNKILHDIFPVTFRLFSVVHPMMTQHKSAKPNETIRPADGRTRPETHRPTHSASG